MRPIRPENIMVITTMFNFWPRPTAQRAAYAWYGGENNLFDYDWPHTILARAVGIQHYRTALLIMWGSAAMPDELKVQYERLLDLHFDMEELYTTWYGSGKYNDGGVRYLAKDLSCWKSVNACFREYRRVTGIVIRLSRKFRRNKHNGKEIAAELKKAADKIERLKESIETIIKPLLPEEEEDADDSE